MSNFISKVKSTIDRLGVDIAGIMGGGTKFIDLDDTINAQAFMESDSPGIIWEMVSLEPDPAEPLYTFQFGIGAKTTSDPGNYAMADLLDAVKAVIKVNDSIDVYDYTPGGLGTGEAKQGFLFVSSVSLDPQLFDKSSGLRLISVTGRAADNGS